MRLVSRVLRVLAEVLDQWLLLPDMTEVWRLNRFCGIDWAEGHHDIAIVDDVGGSAKPVQVDDGVSDRGRDLWTGAGADGRAVLVERHVAHPVDACSRFPSAGAARQ